MSARKGPSLAELRVGIFVVVACAILALAIFAIGSQVGLFEHQFRAITYLNNISGLKPGDVVLLGGVEVGNVDQVQITLSDEIPSTARNDQILRRVQQYRSEIDILQTALAETGSRLEEARTELQQRLQQVPDTAPELVPIRSRITDLERKTRQQEDDISEFERDIDNEMSNLQNIEVLMRINSEYRSWIRADSSISLGSIGLLGDKYIEISMGRTDEPSPETTILVESWLGDSDVSVIVVTGTQQASFAELITGANDILANFETLSDQFQDIMRSFELGQGTVGKFITDPSFYNNLNKTVENANKTMESIRSLTSNIGDGGGTLGRLINDEELYQDISSAVANLEGTLAKINAGEGTLGKLINEPSIYDNANQVIADVSEVTRRIKSGEGTLGQLSTDDRLYVSLRESTEELSAILKDVQDGKGTLGKLAKDEKLYGSINDASAEIVKLLYDFRQDPKKFLTIKFELF